MLYAIWRSHINRPHYSVTAIFVYHTNEIHAAVQKNVWRRPRNATNRSKAAKNTLVNNWPATTSRYTALIERHLKKAIYTLYARGFWRRTSRIWRGPALSTPTRANGRLSYTRADGKSAIMDCGGLSSKRTQSGHMRLTECIIDLIEMIQNSRNMSDVIIHGLA